MRGLEMMRSMPLASAAERRTLRLKLLSTEPKREAERAAVSGTDRGRQVDGEVRVARPCASKGDRPRGRRVAVARAAGDADRRSGTPGPVGLPVAWREGRVAAPLDADVAQVAARRLDDARLDQHLRRLRVERAHELLDLVRGCRRCRATMSTLVRSSTAIEPRGESSSCARGLDLVGRRRS